MPRGKGAGSQRGRGRGNQRGRGRGSKHGRGQESQDGGRGRGFQNSGRGGKRHGGKDGGNHNETVSKKPRQAHTKKQNKDRRKGQVAQVRVRAGDRVMVSKQGPFRIGGSATVTSVRDDGYVSVLYDDGAGTATLQAQHMTVTGDKPKAVDAIAQRVAYRLCEVLQQVMEYYGVGAEGLIRGWDIDGDNRLSLNEIKQGVLQCGIHIDEFMIASAFKTIDLDGNHLINVTELSKALNEAHSK